MTPRLVDQYEYYAFTRNEMIVTADRSQVSSSEPYPRRSEQSNIIPPAGSALRSI